LGGKKEKVNRERARDPIDLHCLADADPLSGSQGRIHLPRNRIQGIGQFILSGSRAADSQNAMPALPRLKLVLERKIGAEIQQGFAGAAADGQEGKLLWLNVGHNGSGFLKLLAKSRLAGHAHLIGGDSAFEEVRQLPHLLQVHKTEGVPGVKDRGDAQGGQALVRHELQVLSHIRYGKASKFSHYEFNV
jgi:hypothetical protein